MLWGGALLLLVVLALALSIEPIVSGRETLIVLLPILPAAFGIALILLDGAARNPFGLSTSGLFPPKRPLSRLFSRADWFVPYRDIRKIEAWNAPNQEARRGHAFGFVVELTSGRRIRISPIGGFGALARYIKTEKEMMQAYRLLKVVMDEVNTPENRDRASRGEDIIIPRDRFEGTLAGSS